MDRCASGSRPPLPQPQQTSKDRSLTEDSNWPTGEGQVFSANEMTTCDGNCLNSAATACLDLSTISASGTLAGIPSKVTLTESSVPLLQLKPTKDLTPNVFSRL